MAKYEPGDKFVIEIDNVISDSVYIVYGKDGTPFTFSENELDSLKKGNLGSIDYNIGYTDGIRAEYARLRNVLFPSEED